MQGAPRFDVLFPSPGRSCSARPVFPRLHQCVEIVPTMCPRGPVCGGPLLCARHAPRWPQPGAPLGGKLTKDRLAAAGVDEALLELTAGADNWVERRALSKKLRRTETHQGATQKAAEARRKCVRRVNFEKEDRDALRNGLHTDARMACSLCSS